MSDTGPAWVMPQSRSAPRSRLALGVGIVAGCVCVASVVPSMMSVMMFDAPGSENNPYVWAFFAGIFCAPLVFLGTSVLAICAYVWRRRRLLQLAIGLPCVLTIYVIVTIILLQSRCAGSFTCTG